MSEYPINVTELEAILERHADSFQTLQRLLIEANQTMNLTRIVEPEQVRVRHFLDSLACLGILDAMASQREKPLSIVDVGSGAGFPSLPLAIVRPGWRFVSVEATGKKAVFQENVCDALGLKNVQVIHGRSEEISHDVQWRQRFDAATARAVADLSILAELTLAFVRPGGKGIFWKGPDIQSEAAAAQKAFEQMGGKLETVLNYSLSTGPKAQTHFCIVLCQKTGSTAKAYPRLYNMIKSKPLSH